MHVFLMIACNKVRFSLEVYPSPLDDGTNDINVKSPIYSYMQRIIGGCHLISS